MIEKVFFGYIINCDKCSNYLVCDIYEEFQRAIDFAKEKDWKIRKDKDDDWEHVCPICCQKEA